MAHDPDETRRRLLDAARDEFSRYGVAGARVDRIAAVAGVNKERIYGHFGNKDGLFEAAVADSMQALTATIEGGDGDHDLGDYVAHKLAYHGEHEDAARLTLWESLERGDAPIAGEIERRAIYDRKAERIAEMLGTDEKQARYAMMVGLALGTIERTFPVLADMILGPDYDRVEFRSFVSDAAGRAVPVSESSEGQAGRRS